MKKLLPLILLLGALALVYFLVIYKATPDNEFHVDDTSLIRKINLEHIVKGEPEAKISLEMKGPGDWVVNGKYQALDVKVEDFLKVLSQIRVKEPIQEAGQESALAILKRNHISVEILGEGGEVLKEYLIGATNLQQTTNIMMIKGASKAWYVGVPGQVGYVSIYYNLEETNWRELLLWDLTGEKLAEVSASYDSVAAGFHLLRKDPTQPWQLSSGKPVIETNVKTYLGLFKGKTYAEGLAPTDTPNLLDSLTRRRRPDVTFAYRDLSGHSDTLKLFLRPNNKNNFFGYLTSHPELYTVQQHVMDPFLRTEQYFAQQPVQ